MMEPGSLAEAVTRHRRGDLDGAELLYRTVVSARPDDAEAHRWLALLLHQRGRDAEACELLERAVILAPASVELHVARAIVLRGLGAREAARSAAEKALSLDARVAAASTVLALLASESGDLVAAAAHYREAARQAPEVRDTHHNLGVVLARMGRDEEAIAAYRRALAIDSHHAPALGNLANLLRRNDAHDEALALYRRLQELEPSSGLARHMTAALSGERVARCPADYVSRLFDECADDFDEHLVDRLEYGTPALLVALLLECATPAERAAVRTDPPSRAGEEPAGGRRFDSVLDLGCGTGLAGRVIRPHCGRLTGIDLSARMIAHAERTGLYDALVVGDVLDAPALAETDWDLALAADAAPYVGDLAPWVRAVGASRARRLWLAFSVEVPTRPTDDYVLSHNGRFAHDARHVRRVATDAGFVVRASRRATLRREGDGVVVGDLWVLSRSS